MCACMYLYVWQNINERWHIIPPEDDKTATLTQEEAMPVTWCQPGRVRERETDRWREGLRCVSKAEGYLTDSWNEPRWILHYGGYSWGLYVFTPMYAYNRRIKPQPIQWWMVISTKKKREKSFVFLSPQYACNFWDINEPHVIQMYPNYFKSSS